MQFLNWINVWKRESNYRLCTLVYFEKSRRCFKDRLFVRNKRVFGSFLFSCIHLFTSFQNTFVSFQHRVVYKITCLMLSTCLNWSSKIRKPWIFFCIFALFTWNSSKEKNAINILLLCSTFKYRSLERVKTCEMNRQKNSFFFKNFEWVQLSQTILLKRN